MAIPDYQTIMLPLLQTLAGGEIVAMRDAIRQVAEKFQLTDEERAEPIPSGKETILSNRSYWARTYLSKAGLLQGVARGQIQITERGKQVLAENPDRIDNKLLDRYPEFKQFRTGNAATEAIDEVVSASPKAESATPEELLRASHEKLDAALAQELLDRITAAPPEFFERLIVSLLVGMGYGGSVPEAGRVLGKSGDNGVDGVIDQDALGLDRVYIQAKRYAAGNKVGSGEIRDFFGSLDRHKAAKGLFVTTSGFSPAARETADYLSKRIVLIDGQQLARLMIRHNVGCRVEETLYLKRIDEDFFE
ncbi:restriction system protein [Dongia mobilis]|uniref:Restriction system protein n=1 Tax=Dongia mobilis TaxID=578943 RepID=A0A4R6WJN2_9PROT|nr:restriction endonuclease [Dongia mobilis]TDQ80496.1 restriction system protein [Dongia mobilis]